jgi:DNA-binding NtrC family response regulator
MPQMVPIGEHDRDAESTDPWNFMNGSQFTKSTAVGRASPTSTRILVIEDEVLFGRAVCRQLEKAGYECLLAANVKEGLSALKQATPNLVLLDLRLPDGSGLELLAELNGSSVSPVIVMTAYGEISDAVQAMKLGAANFLKKPIDLAELELAVEAALKTEELKNQLDCSRERESHAIEPPLLLGNCTSLKAIREQIRQLATFGGDRQTLPPTVLLMGETGTGKDVVARLVHVSGPARTRPFVHVDCAALPRELVEAELFGTERGAYSGAHNARAGLIAAAEDGTLFLDEIAELPLELQAKLLNVIERRRSRRLGSVRERPVGARFVAASNRNLPQMIAQGQFRADLYFRLNVIAITLPPLKQRGEDVLLLARHHGAQASRRYCLPEPRFEPDALQAMMRYSWPGNVRELKHLVERAVLLTPGRPIHASDLSLNDVRPLDAPDSTATISGLTLAAAERLLIEQALQHTEGNVSEAARRLGVSRMTLRYRIEKYNLPIKDDG